MEKAIDIAVNRIVRDSLPPVLFGPVEQFGGESLLSKLILIEEPKRPIPRGCPVDVRRKLCVDEPQGGAILKVRVESVIGKDGSAKLRRLESRAIVPCLNKSCRGAPVADGAHHVFPDAEGDCRPVAAEDGWVGFHCVNAFLQPGVAKREGFVAREGGFDFIWGGCW